MRGAAPCAVTLAQQLELAGGVSGPAVVAECDKRGLHVVDERFRRHRRGSVRVKLGLCTLKGSRT